MTSFHAPNHVKRVIMNVKPPITNEWFRIHEPTTKNEAVGSSTPVDKNMSSLIWVCDDNSNFADKSSEHSLHSTLI